MSLVKHPEMTEKNRAAHRRNGRQSRGAVTPEGKERSRAANLRHGIYSQQRDTALRALGEDPAERAELLDAAYEQWQPANRYQQRVMEQLVSLQWRQERAARRQEHLEAEHLERVQGEEDRHAAWLAELRETIREHTLATTTFGYGPRFLHSTGQFHKGGPKTGRFLQLIHDGPEDVEIPGRVGGADSFTTLKNAQAIGDLETLRSLELPAERVRLQGGAGGDPANALRALTAKIKEML